MTAPGRYEATLPSDIAGTADLRLTIGDQTTHRRIFIQPLPEFASPNKLETEGIIESGLLVSLEEATTGASAHSPFHLRTVAVALGLTLLIVFLIAERLRPPGASPFNGKKRGT